MLRYGGWAADSASGALQMAFLATATPVPATAVFLGGCAFTQAGSRYAELITGAVPATAVWRGGLAHRPDGAVYVKQITTTPPLVVGGLPIFSDGALAVTLGGIPAIFQHGLPLTNDLASSNLLAAPEDLTNVAWTATRASVVANQTTAPDGSSGSDKVVEDATAGATHFLFQSLAKAASALPYAASVFLKPNSRTWAAVNIFSGGSSAFQYFNLATGVKGSSGSAGFTFGSSFITPAGNGHFRCGVTATSDSTATVAVGILMANADLGASYNGDGASNLFAWGAQLEQAATWSSYIRSQSARAAGSALCVIAGT